MLAPRMLEDSRVRAPKPLLVNLGCAARAAVFEPRLRILGAVHVFARRAEAHAWAGSAPEQRAVARRQPVQDERAAASVRAEAAAGESWVRRACAGASTPKRAWEACRRAMP